MNRFRMGVAIVGALVFAIPIVSFVAAMVVFPLLFFLALAVVANFGLILFAARAGLRRLGRDLRLDWFVEPWLYCSILWIGCAFGLSRWGDVGSSMGARNIPYLKVLFAPYLWLAGVPIE